MKYSSWKIIGMLLIATISSACGGGENNDAKKPWTAKEKQEFKDGCFLSTRFSLEQMKQAADSANIVSICACTADEIESQYNFEAAKRIPKAEINKILEKALAKCAPEAMADSSSINKQ